MSQEIVIKLPQLEPLPANVQMCPRCRGSKREGDGSFSVSATEVRIKPASKCRLCNGSGLVTIEAYEG